MTDVQSLVSLMMVIGLALFTTGLGLGWLFGSVFAEDQPRAWPGREAPRRRLSAWIRGSLAEAPESWQEVRPALNESLAARRGKIRIARVGLTAAYVDMRIWRGWHGLRVNLALRRWERRTRGARNIVD